MTCNIIAKIFGLNSVYFHEPRHETDAPLTCGFHHPEICRLESLVRFNKGKLSILLYSVNSVRAQ